MWTHFDGLRTKVLLKIFYDFLIRHFKKRKKSCFLKYEKNVKYVFKLWWAPPAGSGVEPRPKTDFGVFWRPQNTPFCTNDKNLRGTICSSVRPLLQILGNSSLPPGDLCPCRERQSAPVLRQSRLYDHQGMNIP